VRKQLPKALAKVCLAGMLTLHGVMAWNARRLIVQGYPDFTIFYTAGKMLRAGLGSQLYNMQAQIQTQQSFVSKERARQGSLPYNHPPFEAVVFVPFAHLPYIEAYLLWDSVNLLALFAAVALLRSKLPLLTSKPLLFWGLVSLAFYPVFLALLQGQDVILLLFVFTLTFLCLRAKRDLAAGLCLGFGLFRFHLVLPMLLILGWQKRRRVLLSFATVALGLGLISIAAVGWKEALYYPKFVWQVEGVIPRAASVDITLRGFGEAILQRRIPEFWTTIFVVFTSTVLLSSLARQWKPVSRGWEFDLGFSLCLMVTILVSFHAFVHELSLLLLPLFLLANHLPAMKEFDGWTGVALFAPPIFFFSIPLQFALGVRYNQATFLVPLLLLWAWGIRRLQLKSVNEVNEEQPAPTSG
jgi:hypothetical protein